ncbi:MAG: cupin domain-containing protein [Ktedonobacteraceae bacterium]
MRAFQRTIDNPVTGERVTFLNTAEETGGEFVKSRVELAGRASGTSMHYHLAFTETFEVLGGTLDVCIGGKKGHRILMPGETAVVPRRVHHRFWNSSTQTSVFTIEIRPAQHFEQALRAAFGLARDGKVNKVGIPTNIWELALVFQLAESFLPGAPLFLQKGLFGMLAAIARQRGYDPAFSQYTGAKGVK